MGKKSKADDFLVTRRVSKINRVLIIVMSLTLLLGVNYLASNIFFRGDITRNHVYSLSPESMAYIKKLEKPVKIYVTIPPESEQKQTSEIYLTISQLLREYQYSSRFNKKGKVEIEYINPYRQSQRAQEIASRFKVNKENAIIVTSGENFHQVSANDLYTFEDGELNGFNGEQVITSAILDVTSEKKTKIYFLAGHGEKRINSVDPLRGLSQVSDLLKSHNFEVEEFSMVDKSEVPEDASLVVIASPQTPLLKKEEEALRKYLSARNGRVIAFLDPIVPHGMEDVLYEWGILVDDLIVFDFAKNAQAKGGDLMINRYAQHPVTQFLLDYQLAVLTGLTRPARPDAGAPLDPALRVTPLLASSDTSWAERYYEDKNGAELNKEHDLEGPVAIATLSERSISSQLGISIPGGRFIVFGSSDLISNNRINVLGNKVLFTNSVNWSLNRNELLSIPPRALNKYQIAMSKDDLVRASTYLMFYILGIGFFGFMVWVIRKR